MIPTTASSLAIKPAAEKRIVFVPIFIGEPIPSPRIIDVQCAVIGSEPDDLDARARLDLEREADAKEREEAYELMFRRETKSRGEY
jgi:hypothetical protein